jgi:hypothetical protein
MHHVHDAVGKLHAGPSVRHGGRVELKVGDDRGRLALAPPVPMMTSMHERPGRRPRRTKKEAGRPAGRPPYVAATNPARRRPREGLRPYVTAGRLHRDLHVEAPPASARAPTDGVVDDGGLRSSLSSAPRAVKMSHTMRLLAATRPAASATPAAELTASMAGNCCCSSFSGTMSQRCKLPDGSCNCK